jgi:hypothetical protein
VFFLDGGAVGRVRHQHGLAQVFGGFIRVLEQILFQLLETGLEESKLRFVHVVLLVHLEDLFLGQQLRCRGSFGSLGCHFAYFQYYGFSTISIIPADARLPEQVAFESTSLAALAPLRLTLTRSPGRPGPGRAALPMAYAFSRSGLYTNDSGCQAFAASRPSPRAAFRFMERFMTSL